MHQKDAQKRKAKVPQLTQNERLVLALEKVVKAGGVLNDRAQSLIHWYLNRGGWSPAQANFAATIVAKNRNPRARDQPKRPDQKPAKWLLCAMTAGDEIKVSLTNHATTEREKLSRERGEEFKVIWEFYLGRSEEDGRKFEKKLRRYLSDFKSRQGWYDSSAADAIKAFSPHFSGWGGRYRANDAAANKAREAVKAAKKVSRDLDSEFYAIIGR